MTEKELALERYAEELKLQLAQHAARANSLEELLRKSEQEKHSLKEEAHQREQDMRLELQHLKEEIERLHSIDPALPTPPKIDDFGKMQEEKIRVLHELVGDEKKQNEMLTAENGALQQELSEIKSVHKMEREGLFSKKSRCIKH